MSYAKQKILIATKHDKEKVIGPVFKKHLGCDVFVGQYDTDQLGTFTGEIPRLDDALATCKSKALHAATHEKHSLVIASEGSFGPHPTIPFLPITHEIMVFFNLKSNIFIYEQLMTEQTNYQIQRIDKFYDLNDFLKRSLFPSHALCVQTSNLNTVIAKGITSYPELERSLEKGFKLDQQLLLSTDMRAMMNPTRMNIISELAEKLALRILTKCPECKVPGFGKIGVDGFLHCSDCHMPSKIFAYELYGCVKCDFQEKKTRTDGKVSVSPQYCEFCNP